MTHTRHLGRCVVVGVGALVLSGAGIAAATTPPTEPPPDTALDTTDTAIDTVDTAVVATSEPMGGAGPSDCPAITETAPDTEVPVTTDALAGTVTTDISEAPVATELPTDTEATIPSDLTVAEIAETTEPTVPVPPAGGPFVQIAESVEYGPILVDAECRTLYGFTQDVDGEPTCIDDCAANWPPLFVPDDAVPPLADELDPILFSVVEHAEGPMLKVGDWPLYHFAGDDAPGDINGQGVGDVWWLVAPDGTLLEEAADTEDTEPTAETVAPDETAPTLTIPTDTSTITTEGL
jgi:predicted lipoprotein with Yx(FWY)xxD motif